MEIRRSLFFTEPKYKELLFRVSDQLAGCFLNHRNMQMWFLLKKVGSVPQDSIARTYGALGERQDRHVRLAV